MGFNQDESHLLRSQNANVYNRVVNAYVTSIDQDKGLVSIRFEDFVGARDSIDLSCDYISSVGLGWFRFMPQIGDKVIGAFHQDNTFEILRYKSVNYGAMTGFANAANPPFLFRSLNPGEFEIMSSGMAAIWGSDGGTLEMSGGMATIQLDDDSIQATHNASLHQFITATSSTLNFGVIRNSLPTSANTYDAISDGFQDVAWDIQLAKSLGGELSLALYDCTIGRVTDFSDLGIYTDRLQTVTEQPLRADILFYGEDGIQNLRAQIDVLGNVRIDLPATATDGAQIVSSVGSLLLQFLNATIKASGELNLEGAAQTTLSSNTAVTADAPLVQLGSQEAIDPVVKGIETTELLAAFFAACATSETDPTLAAAASTAATLLATGSILSTVTFTE